MSIWRNSVEDPTNQRSRRSWWGFKSTRRSHAQTLNSLEQYTTTPGPLINSIISQRSNLDIWVSSTVLKGGGMLHFDWERQTGGLKEIKYLPKEKGNKKKVFQYILILCKTVCLEAVVSLKLNSKPIPYCEKCEKWFVFGVYPPMEPGSVLSSSFFLFNNDYSYYKYNVLGE